MAQGQPPAGFVRVFRSAVAASPEEVWAVVSTMDGVNAELGPWIRMTHPSHLRSLTDAPVVEGQVLFPSWLLAGGVLPIDRHALGLERVDPGVGFAEASTSWLQRRWRHQRRLTPLPGGGCLVADRLEVEPRVPIATPLVARIVTALFEHRHRRLRARFGDAGGHQAP